jgi:hypothetical protein
VSGQSTRILAELDIREPSYAVLDGARDPRIRRWIFDTRAPRWCLYRGRLPPAIEDAAPWLLRVIPGDPRIEEFLARGWGRSWGILFTSQAPSRELRRHLRRFLRVRTAQGRILAFRYYDPRVLRVYLPSCEPAENATFFGPITSLIAESEDGGPARVFRPANARPAPAPSLNLWTIRDEQLAAFHADLERQLAGRAVAYLRRQYAAACAALGDAAVIRSVETALEKRAAYRFDSEETVFAWLDLMYLLGRDFDTNPDPRFEWARERLKDFDLGARTRLLLLVEEVRADLAAAGRAAS